MKIPYNIIEDVRNATDIVELIGQSVRLKKSGKNFMGLCPFHQEKTPSFSVHPEKQIYKCFGCGEGGSVFDFLMKEQNISFFEAVKQLAERAGIPLPKFREEASDKQELEALYAVNDFANAWYQNNLWNAKASEKALTYLHKRGFKDETIKTFELGYALDDWEELVRAARKASYTDEVLINSGLALQKEQKGTPYDRFRNRIIFPIKNEFGRTIGFGARKFDESEPPDSPKYINSPETTIYQKGRTLYGLYQNKNTIRKNDLIVLVEGYTDVMALDEFNIGLGVASLGTSLTSQQAHLINRYTKNVVLLYDADAPGLKAALRGSEILFDADLDVQVVNLGGDADPDSFLRTHGRDAFIEAIKRRQSIVSFYASSFTTPGKELSYQEKTERIREIIELVDAIKDSLKRELMLKEIGEKLSADVKTIFKEYYRKKRSRQRRGFTREEPASEPKVRLPELEPLEREIGALVINAPEIAKAVLKYIMPGDITSTIIQNIIEVATNCRNHNSRCLPADIINAAEDDTIRKVIADLAFDQKLNPVYDDQEAESRLIQVADDIIIRLKRLRIERQIAAVQEQIKQTQSKGENIMEYVKQCQALQVERNKLTHNR